MRPQTVELKRQLKALRTPQERMAALRNAYQGEECYIVCCGPSLSEVDPELLRHKLSDKLVLSFKQAYDLLPNESDFHVFNFIHFQDYDYGEQSPIAVELTRFGKVLAKATDLPVPINVREAGIYPASVAHRKNFDHYLFERTLNRPFGPGIVYEVGFYLAVHLGVSGITTLGFDCTNPSTHFYGAESVKPERMKILKREMGVVVTGMHYFANWLERKKAPLKLISSINPAPPSIPRLTIEDIPEPL